MTRNQSAVKVINHDGDDHYGDEVLKVFGL